MSCGVESTAFVPSCRRSFVRSSRESWEPKRTHPLTQLSTYATVHLARFDELTSMKGIDVTPTSGDRVGLHTGGCEVRGDDLGAPAVHIAAREAALAGPGEVLVSGLVKDLVVSSGIEFKSVASTSSKVYQGS